MTPGSYSNRNPAEWLRLNVYLEHGEDPSDRLREDFEKIFNDDKREPELSDPRYIEDFIEEVYDDER